MKDVMTKLSWSIVSQYLFFTCQAFCKGISKRILISFLLILLFAESFGQGEANVWYFGSRCGMEFPGGGTPIPKSSSSVGGSDIMESASSISDAAGNFLFGTNGSNIFSADLVTRGTLPNGSNEQQAQGAMIIPVPGVSGEYYLSTVVSSCNAKPAYTNITVTGTTGNNIIIGSKVDLEGGITQGQMVLPKTDASGNFTDEFWLVHHQLGTDKFNVYSVTSTGINPTPIYKTAGPVMAGSCGDNTAYFKANACYDQFAYSYGSDVYLFDFDTRTADITYKNSKNVPNAYGIEFSKNGKHVYISTGTMNNQNPSVYEIEVAPGGMGSTLQGTPTHVMTLAQTSRGGCLQMGPDGKIYCASFSFSGTGPYLGVISDPENATGYDPYGVNLGSGVSIGMGLPAFITSLVSSVVDLKLGGISAASTSICNNTSVLLSGELNKNVAASADWEITDPSGGVITYFNQNNFNHTFNGVGIHKVKIKVKDDCGRDKISLVDVNVEEKQIVNATEDACISGNRLLTGTGSASGNYKWYSGNPSSGGVLLSIGATYQATAGSQVWIEPAGSITSNNIAINDTRNASRSGDASGNTTIVLGPGTSSINSFNVAYYHNYNGSPVPGSITLELRDANNNVIGTPLTRSIPNTGQWIALTNLAFNPTDWNNLSAGTYTVVLTKSLPPAIMLGAISGSYSSGGFSINGGATFKYNITNSSNVETSSVNCKEGKLINVSICCNQPTPDLSISSSSVCEGDNITLTASTSATGTIIYEFSKGSTILGTTTSPVNTYTLNNVTSTDAGSYTVKVLSSTTCTAPSTASAEATLTVNPNPVATLSASTTSICPGGSTTLDVQVTGGTGPWTVTYTVNSTAQTLTVPVSGTAQLTATAAGDYEITKVVNTNSNCSKAITGQKISITESEVIEATAISVCRDQLTHYQLKVEISKGSITGASNFKVTNSSGGAVVPVSWTESPSGSGIWISGDIDETITVNLEITNSNGCSGKTISNLGTQCSCPAIAILSFSGSSAICLGETSTIDVAYSGGAGNYDIELIQPDGTKQTKTNLSGSSTSFTVSQNGNYSAIVTSLADNCSSPSGSVTLTVHNLPTVVANANSTSICEGETVTLTGSGAVTYSWNNSAINGIPLVLTSTTSFTLTGEDVHGCKNTDAITITVNPAPQPRTIADTIACLGEDAFVVIPNAQSSVRYQINGTGQEYSGSGDLTIPIEAADLHEGTNLFNITAMATGCNEPIILDNVSVVVLGKATASSDENLLWTDNACEGKSFGILDMSGSGVNGYDWQVSPSPATLVKNGLTSTLHFNGTSSVTLTAIPSIDGFTCPTSNLTKTIDLIPAYIPEILVASEDTICVGDTITFSVLSSNDRNTFAYTLQYSITLGIEEMKDMHTSNNGFVFRFNEPGNLDELVISATPHHACGVQEAIKRGVTVIDRPIANAGSDDYINDYATIHLKGDESTPLNSTLYSYTWSSPDPKAGIADSTSINTTGDPLSRITQYLFTVKSKNERGCVSSDMKEVVINIELITPNIFSPNGDGIHDTFVLGNIELFPKAVIYIYNQWGELVFKSEPGYTIPWDGSRDNKPCTIGTYYYILELNEDGYKPITGAVSIVK